MPEYSLLHWLPFYNTLPLYEQSVMNNCACKNQQKMREPRMNTDKH